MNINVLILEGDYLSFVTDKSLLLKSQQFSKMRNVFNSSICQLEIMLLLTVKTLN